MYAEVDQRAAAGAGLVAEPAARESAATEIGCLSEVDVTEVTLINKADSLFGVCAVTSYETYHKELACFFSGSLHFFSFSSVHSHGLFAEDVAACFESSDRAFLVSAVPYADGNEVELFSFYHFSRACVIMGDVVSLCKIRRLFFNDVAACNDLDSVAERLVAVNMAV